MNILFYICFCYFNFNRLFIYLLHIFGILNLISEYFKEQKYYYDNGQPNLFTSILNTIDFTKGITKVYDCAIDSVVDTDKINKRL